MGFKPNVASSGSGGTPAGSSGYIQFNTSSAFDAEANLFWDKTNNRLGICGSTPLHSIDVGAAGDGICSRGSVYTDALAGGGASTVLLANGVVCWNDASNGSFDISLGTRNPDGSVASVTTYVSINGSVASAVNIKNSYQLVLSAGSFIKLAGDTTGSGTTVGFGTNSPASTLTAPYTWLKFISSDASVVWVPAYK